MRFCYFDPRKDQIILEVEIPYNSLQNKSTFL